MLRIHFVQWFNLADLACEEILHDVSRFRGFADQNQGTALPDDATILRFCRLLEQHKLAPQMLTLIHELPGVKAHPARPACARSFL